MNGDKRKIFALARDQRLNSVEAKDAFSRTLAADNRQKITNKLYADGFAWFNSGKSLDEAIQIVDYFGEKTALKDIISFQRGFQEGIRQKGFEFGYSERNLDDVNHKYNNNKYFLDGYKKGYEQCQKEKNKGHIK